MSHAYVIYAKRRRYNYSFLIVPTIIVWSVFIWQCVKPSNLLTEVVNHESLALQRFSLRSPISFTYRSIKVPVIVSCSVGRLPSVWCARVYLRETSFMFPSCTCDAVADLGNFIWWWLSCRLREMKMHLREEGWFQGIDGWCGTRAW